MRKHTLITDVVANDKASKPLSKVNQAFKKVADTTKKVSAVGGSAFSRFSDRIGMGVKKASVSLNNLNAKINRTAHNIKKRLGTLGLAVGLTAITMAAGNTIGVFADFEQANANLSSVMATATIPELQELQKDAKRLGATTAKTSTQVVSLQESLARLGFETPDILNMTGSIISGSVAMQGELAATADLVGAMIKSFDAFESAHTSKVIDQMTVATQKSALNFEKLQTMLPTVAGAANAAGIPFNRLLALLGKLSDAGIDASSSSTALRNIILQSGKQGKNYEEILADIVSQQDKLTTSMNEFGVRAAVPATVLAGKLNETLKLSEDIFKSTGAAAKAEAKTLDTFRGAVTILGSAWEGYILSVEDGKGAIGAFLKDSIRVVTDMLSIASNTAKAKDQLNEYEQKIRNIAETGMKLLSVVKFLIKAFIAFKLAVIALRAATFAYNVVLGVTSALSGSAAIAMKANTVAVKSMNIATKAMTVANWLMNTSLGALIPSLVGVNTVLAATPIGWIILGIGALVTGIVLLIKHWDKVKQAMINTWNVIESNPILKVLLGPVYLLIKNIQLLVQNWDAVKAAMVSFYSKVRENPILSFIYRPIVVVVEMIKTLVKGINSVKEAFKFGGMAEGFKQIGKSLLSFLLTPIRTLLEMIAKIPKVGKFVQPAIDKINKLNESNAEEKVIAKEQTEILRSEIGFMPEFKTQQIAKESNIVEATTEKITTDEKLTNALNKNTTAITDNTNKEKQWKGRFETTIIRDVVGTGMITNQIANSAITNERKIINAQKDVVNNNTQREITNTTTNTNNFNSRSTSEEREIKIFVVDRTSGEYGVEVESTGIKVITTGND